MCRSIVIIGCGFAGIWSAFAAKRLLNLHQSQDIEVVIIAPEPSLTIRPRLYEANPTSKSHHVGSLLNNAGIKFIWGTVESISTQDYTVHVRPNAGSAFGVRYGRLILAAGSTITRPEGIVGIEQFAFDVDSIDAAARLEAHLARLVAAADPGALLNTVVVCGAGFTGIEVATTLPQRLINTKSKFRVVLVDPSQEVGHTLGPGPRPIIVEALQDLGIELKLGHTVTAIDAKGVTLSSGEHIEASTVVWTAGLRATQLPTDMLGEKDRLGRYCVNEYLQVTSTKHVFATGDMACAVTDDKGHLALMSCQHALILGRYSGHNAAADLLGQPMMPYSQPAYNTCLDLGSWGAVLGAGWDRIPAIQGDVAKRLKNFINQQLIYPPLDVQTALAEADPVQPDSDEVFRMMLAAVS